MKLWGGRFEKGPSEIFERFSYSPQTTRVDSPIDDALGARTGVCQDFAHIMIALVRGLGVPCRYVEMPGKGHGWLGDDLTRTLDQTVDFLREQWKLP